MADGYLWSAPAERSGDGALARPRARVQSVPPHPNPLPKERENRRPVRNHSQRFDLSSRWQMALPLLGERVGVRGKGLNKAVGVLANIRIRSTAERSGDGALDGAINAKEKRRRRLP